MGDDNYRELPLFNGPHIRHIRFDRALDCLDLQTAVEAAPAEWKTALGEMAAILEHAGGPAGIKTADLIRCRRPEWPTAVERAWALPNNCGFAVSSPFDELRVSGKLSKTAQAELVEAGQTSVTRIVGQSRGHGKS